MLIRRPSNALILVLLAIFLALAVTASDNPRPEDTAWVSHADAWADVLGPLVEPVNVVAGGPIWCGGVALVAGALWLAGRRLAGAVLLSGLTVEAATLLAKLVVMVPWLLDHATATGSGFMVVEPDVGANRDAGYVAASPELQFSVEFATPGTYVVWLRARADEGDGDSVHLGLDGEAVATADRALLTIDRGWSWKSATMDGAPPTLTVPSPGRHTVNVWMREDGIALDRLLLTIDEQVPHGHGPAESPQASGAFLEVDGQVVLEAEHAQENRTLDDQTWVRKTDPSGEDLRRSLRAIRRADFPSGHAARAVVALGLLVALVVERRRRWWPAALLVAVGLALLVGAARIAAGAHTQLGVVGGFALGSLWVVVLLRLWRRWGAGSFLAGR